MAVLDPSEYDIKYFDPQDPRNTSGLAHNAGYTKYQRWRRYDDGFAKQLDPAVSSCGDYFGDIAQIYNYQGFLQGKTILDLGCAKGWLVEWLRDQGFAAWGIDASAYAIGEARADIQQYLTVGDVRTLIPLMARNQYNVIVSRWFMDCMSDADLAALIPELNRVCMTVQIHQIWLDYMPEYYNCHTLDWWLNSAGFERGTRIVVKDDVAHPYIVS